MLVIGSFVIALYLFAALFSIFSAHVSNYTDKAVVLRMLAVYAFPLFEGILSVTEEATMLKIFVTALFFVFLIGQIFEKDLRSGRVWDGFVLLLSIGILSQSQLSASFFIFFAIWFFVSFALALNVLLAYLKTEASMIEEIAKTRLS